MVTLNITTVIMASMLLKALVNLGHTMNKPFLLITSPNPCQKLNIENPRGTSPVPPTPSLLPGGHPGPTTIPETTSSTTGTTPAVTTAAHHFRWEIS